VQQTADGIFGRLMEVDHAVILFDEIDELVREREQEPDQLGDFSPRACCRAWRNSGKRAKSFTSLRTNHIEFFDRAITRASGSIQLYTLARQPLRQEDRDSMDL